MNANEKERMKEISHPKAVHRYALKITAVVQSNRWKWRCEKLG
jgi:hypothetical protein